MEVFNPHWEIQLSFQIVNFETVNFSVVFTFSHRIFFFFSLPLFILKNFKPMVKLEKNEHSYILYLDSPFVNIVLHLLSLFLSIIFYFVKYLIFIFDNKL